MSEPIKLNSGGVATLADTDRVVACDSTGALRSIPLADLLAQIRSSIQIGGRNLIKGSAEPITSVTSKTYNLSTPLKNEPAGSEFTISFSYEFSGITLGDNPRMGLQISVKNMGSYNQYIDCYLYPESTNGKGRVFKVNTLPEGMDLSGSYVLAFIQRTGTGSVKIYDFKLERGNIPTDWTPAPEDLSQGVKRYDSTSCEESQKGGQRDGRSDNHKGMGKLSSFAFLPDKSIATGERKFRRNRNCSRFETATTEVICRSSCREYGRTSDPGLVCDGINHYGHIPTGRTIRVDVLHAGSVRDRFRHSSSPYAIQRKRSGDKVLRHGLERFQTLGGNIFLALGKEVAA